MKNIAALILASLMFNSSVLADSNARSYQDCILEVTRDGYLTSKQDVGRVKELCEQRFPDSAPNILGEKLDGEQLAKVDIYTNRGDKGEISGTVYNGNPDIILTRLELLITPNTDKGSVMDFFDSEEYEINLKIKPYSTKEFTIEPEKTTITGLFSWKLIRAWGY